MLPLPNDNNKTNLPRLPGLVVILLVEYLFFFSSCCGVCVCVLFFFSKTNESFDVISDRSEDIYSIILMAHPLQPYHSFYALFTSRKAVWFFSFNRFMIDAMTIIVFSIFSFKSFLFLLLLFIHFFSGCL